MNIAQIIARARRVAKYQVSNLSDTGALELLNVIKDEFWAEIVSRLEEDYNWEEWKASSVAGQAEYTLPPLTSTSDGTKALKTVAIAYGTEVYSDGGLKYEKASLVNASSLSRDWDFYENTQSQLNPIYYVSDNSIFIAPKPTVAVTNGIKMTGVRKIPDYALNTLEQDVKIPVDFHRVLVFGLAYEMALDKGIPSNEIQEYLSNYEFNKSKALKALAMRSEGPVTMFYPSEIESTFNDII